ncbi:toll/interleukin-1 receptor domain-containing protein [Streptomyces sp. NPDC059491]|uniref:toll/interleukin-1 receptor domain-containing protein n=1 Tax=Streptomyces sp. NPDC059491 TaxID=3346850 RepID=UPI00367D18DE
MVTGDDGRAAPTVEDYDAFISYTHRPDHALAKAIQRGLLAVGRKAWRAPTIRVFRDEETLYSTVDLPKTLQHHLDRSRHLILVASPESARAEYVLAEVAYWLRHKSSENILIAMAGGEISWPAGSRDFDWNRTTALPEALKGRLSAQPLWSDFRGLQDDKGAPLTLRDEKFLSEIAKLGARLHGVQKEVLVGIEQRNQRKDLRRAYTAVTVLLVLLTAVGLLAYVANDQREKAEQCARSDRGRLAANWWSVHGSGSGPGKLPTGDPSRTELATGPGATLATRAFAVRSRGDRRFGRQAERGGVGGEARPASSSAPKP